MTVVTRFAPSPTGFLHIGGARTALFNHLYARHHGGRYLLRIEDTDRERSTEQAIDAILDGLSWLGLEADEPPVFQSRNADRHAALARQLLADGKAYHCYCTPEELQEMRDRARAEGRPVRYDGRWRDRDPADAPSDIPPVVRLKAPQDGETVIHDLVQGEVRVANSQLDDMVLLRSDGTPVYMLSVVVDDHDMGVTHVIRGDDHLTNAFRQTQLFNALGFPVPAFGHIPLIHGPDGKKLSKRHGALAVQDYREQGYLPEALRNYLLRLGWGHGDEEIIDDARAIELFDLDGVGRAAARFDFAKLEALNAHYLRESDNLRLVELIAPRLSADLGHPLDDAEFALLTRAMDGLKERARTVTELAENAAFYVARRPITLNDKARKLLDGDAPALLGDLRQTLADLDPWNHNSLEEAVRNFSEEHAIKLGKVAQPMRAALTGSNASPGIFEVAELLGKAQVLGRIDDAIGRS